MNLHKNIIKGWLPENGRKCRNFKKRNHHIQWRRLKIRFCYIPVGYSSIFILVCIIKHPLNILLIHLQSINQLNSLRDSSLIRKDKFYHFELTRIKVFLSILFLPIFPQNLYCLFLFIHGSQQLEICFYAKSSNRLYSRHGRLDSTWNRHIWELLVVFTVASFVGNPVVELVKKTKKLILRHKFKFSNHYIFRTWWCKL